MANNMQTLGFNVPGMTGTFTVVDAEARAQLENKLDATALPEAIDTALAQAKESGEFDGAPGYTPVKGKDYFDGEDGISPTVAVSNITGGHRITITDKSGAKTVDVMDGEDGDPGSDATVTSQSIQTALGYAPADAANVVQRQQGSANVGKILAVGSDGNIVLVDMPEASAGDVTGFVDESNNIVLTGDLADGTYTLKYLKADGTYVDAGELVVSSIATYAIICNLTNCTSSGADTIRQGGTATITVAANDGYNLPDSIVVSGADYAWDKSSGQIALSNPTSDVTITVAAVAAPTYTNLADQTSADWKKNARINSSGSQVSATGVDITNYIPVQDTSVIHIKGLDILSPLPSGSNYGRVYYYDSNKTWVTYGQPSTTGGDFYHAADYDDTVTVYNWAAAKQYFGALKDVEVSYMRFGGIPTADDIIITVDEPIA